MTTEPFHRYLIMLPDWQGPYMATMTKFGARLLVARLGFRVYQITGEE